MISPLDSVWEKRWVFGRRYLWRVALFALAALGFSWIITHSVTTVYRAESEIAFKSTNYPFKFDLTSLLGNQIPLFMEDDVYYVSYDIPTILSSDRIAYNVLDRNDLKDRLYDPEVDKPWEEWFEDFHGHLFFKVHSDTKTITIAYAAESPELAKEITQLFTEEFENYFASLYWHKSLAAALNAVVTRRTEELAEIDVMIDQVLVPQGRIAVKRTASQDIHDYLFAERAKLLAKARLVGYQKAVEEVRAIIATAEEGGKFSIPREAARDYILTFLKGFYYQGYLYRTELETEYTSEHPEVKFWDSALGVTEDIVVRASGNAAMIAYNTLLLRRAEAKANYTFWVEKAAGLEKTVDTLPQFEKDVYSLKRKQKFLEFTLWYWEKRMAFQQYGEEFTDDPFMVLDEPTIPERAYYPILKVWIYAFPVLLVIGTIVFLLRFKLEEECIADIKAGLL